MTWYALPGGHKGRSPAELTRDIERAGLRDDSEAWVWTVSRHPLNPGWNTDGGYPGYGLSKEDAEFLAAAANEKEARDRV
jgi:hypothetical protein